MTVHCCMCWQRWKCHRNNAPKHSALYSWFIRLLCVHLQFKNRQLQYVGLCHGQLIVEDLSRSIASVSQTVMPTPYRKPNNSDSASILHIERPLPTIYICSQPNCRLIQWISVSEWWQMCNSKLNCCLMENLLHAKCYALALKTFEKFAR
jgi:hypothetical protein